MYSGPTIWRGGGDRRQIHLLSEANVNDLPILSRQQIRLHEAERTDNTEYLDNLSRYPGGSFMACWDIEVNNRVRSGRTELLDP